ncbi:recombinase family protein [Pseudomonas sp. YL-218 TE3947]|uniref:recombinase family protein n=1 Tax=Pseudomonas TaxID=286 RepID=UPI003D24EA0F
MKLVAYYRVSTRAQGESGLGLEAQKAYVETACKTHGWEVVAEYIETVSGSIVPLERPECAKALAHGLPIIVAKLDRLSRDVEHIASLMKRVSLKVATMPQADNFQLHLFAALAEQERAFISQRTKEALQALKERANAGCEVSIQKIANRSAVKPEGSKNLALATARAARSDKANAFAVTVEATIALAQSKGHSTLNALAQFMNDRKVFTAQGGEWSSMQVSRVLKRLNVDAA